MVKKLIAVDVDDVLAGVSEAMMHFVNRNFGTDHSWDEYTKPGPYWRYWESVWNVGEEEGMKRYNAFIDAGSHRTVPIVEGAIETLEWLKKKFDLAVITAREDSYAENTHHWLEKNFPQVFEDIRFLPSDDEGKKVHKAVVAKEIGASYLIDDHIGHCLPADKAGITCLLFGDYGWNKHVEIPESIIRVKNWAAVKNYFDGRN